MVRELVADLKRWREDRRTNSRKYTRITGPKMSEKAVTTSDQLRVGDLIEVMDH